MKLLERTYTHIWPCALLVFGLTSVFLACLLPICSAYAAYEGGDGGSHNIGGQYPNFGTVWFEERTFDIDPPNIGYGVVAYTQYDAAMYDLLGSFNFSDLSAAKKRKLLANSDFYTFANTFHVGKPAATADWAADAAIVLAWNSARNLYGETYCYSALYSMAQYDAAEAAARRIMIEDDTGTGGGGGSNTGSGLSELPDDVTMYFVNNGANFAGDSFVWHVSDTDRTQLMDLMERYEMTYSYATLNAGNAGGGDFNFWMCNQDFEYIYGENDELLFVAFDTEPVFYNVLIGNNYHLSESDGLRLTYISGSTYRRTANYSSEYGKYVYNLRNVGYVSDHFKQSGGGGGEGGGGDDPTPPTPWPDPPQDPVGGEPDVPGPGDPTVPIDPTPPTPWNPIPGIDIDITGDDFQDLLDALNEHCIHLQTSIQDNISQLWSLQSDLISDRFDWLGNDVIIPSFSDLKDYLHELFEWLAERMTFNINVTNGQYDDTSVVAWLKKIWAKMGDGINTQPTDPVQEPDDWWAWLFALMGNFVSMLLAFGSDKLGAISEGLGALTGKFPFSLPWDLMALLAMLDAPAQTPEWDIPCFAVSLEGLQQVGSYHISLDAYDQVWENVRWIERLSFIVLLVRSTDLFTGMMRKAVGKS